jgi:hypothetical protein
MCQLVVIRLIAHSCLEVTVRCAAELGYEVTAVKGRKGGDLYAEMHAARDINIPNDTNAVVTTKKLIETIGPAGP